VQKAKFLLRDFWARKKGTLRILCEVFKEMCNRIPQAGLDLGLFATLEKIEE
jgi:hypothetical protein